MSDRLPDGLVITEPNLPEGLVITEPRLPAGLTLTEPFPEEELATLIDDPSAHIARTANAAIYGDVFGLSSGESFDIEPDIVKALGESNSLGLLKETFEAYKAGWSQVNRDSLGYELRTGQNTDPFAWQKIDQYNEAIRKSAGRPKRKLLGQGLVGLSRLMPFMIKTTSEGAKVGAVTTGAVALANLIAGQLGPQAALPEELLTVLPIVVAGVAAGRSIESAKIMTGGLYLDLIENNISEPRARIFADVGGALMGALETVNLDELAAVPHLRQALLGAARKGAKSAAGRIGVTAARWGGTIAKEVFLEEVPQEIVAIAIEETAAHLETARVTYLTQGIPINRQTWDQMLERVKETAIQSALSFALLTLPGHVAQGASLGVNEGLDVEQAVSKQAEIEQTPQERQVNQVTTARVQEEIRDPVTKAIESQDEEHIVNPVEGTTEEKIQQLRTLSFENIPILETTIAKIDTELDAESKVSLKAEETIAEKAKRLEIVDEKPWHDVEHVRDSLRFKAVVQNPADFGRIVEIIEESGAEVVKIDTAKMVNPKEWGWRFAGVDVRMPNGQLVEFYMPMAELEEVKKPNHLLFEKWRDVLEVVREKEDPFWDDVDESHERYDQAFSQGLARLGVSDEEFRASWTKEEAKVSSTREKLANTSLGEKEIPLFQVPSASRDIDRASGVPRGDTSTRPVSESARTIEEPSIPIVAQKEPAVKKKIDQEAVKEAEDFQRELREARNLRIDQLFEQVEEGPGRRELRQAVAEGRREGVAQEKLTAGERKVRDRARKETRARFNKIKNDLKKAEKIATEGKVSSQHLGPIRELLSDLDLVKSRQAKTLSRLAGTKRYLEDNPNVDMPDSVVARLGILDKTPLGQMTMEGLEDVHDAVMAHLHLEKKKQEIKVGREQRQFEQAREDAIEEMKPLPKESKDPVDFGKKDNPVLSAGKWTKLQLGIRSNHYDLIVEKIAGPNSIVDKIFSLDITQGTNKELKHLHDVFDKFNADLEESGFSVADRVGWMNKDRFSANMGGRQVLLTRGHRMALAMHAKNPDNRASILGKGISLRNDPGTVFTPTDGDLNKIVNSLTVAEKQFIGAVQILFKEQGEAMGKVFLEKNGWDLRLEENYYPKHRNPLGVDVDPEQETALEKFKGKWIRPGVKKNMLEHRQRVEIPLYLDSIARDMNDSVYNAAAYVGLEIPMSNASKLLFDQKFRSEMRARYGPETLHEIEQGLRDIAGQWKDYTSLEEGMLKIRANLSTAYLGLNPFVIPKQTLSYMMYSPYVKVKYLMEGATDYIKNGSEIVDRHTLYSPEYRERNEGGFSRDLTEIARQGGPERQVLGAKQIKEKFMGGIKWADKQTVTPGMQAAVLQVLDEFKEGKLSREPMLALDLTPEQIAKLTPEQKMEQAYTFADYATQRTQPSFAAAHRSPLSRGSAWEKTFTQFSSFTNTALSLMRRSMDDAIRTKTPAAYKKAALAILSVMVLNTLGNAGLDELRDWMYGRPGSLFWQKIVSGWAGFHYGIRDGMRSLFSKINHGTFIGRDIQLPIARVGATIVNTLVNINNMVFEDTKKKRGKAALRALDSAVESVMTPFGYPYTPVRSLVKGIVKGISKGSK